MQLKSSTSLSFFFFFFWENIYNADSIYQMKILQMSKVTNSKEAIYNITRIVLLWLTCHCKPQILFYITGTHPLIYFSNLHSAI